MVVIAAIYAFIIRVVMKRNKLMRDIKITSVQGEAKREETAVIITCALVVGAFIFCTLPFCINMLISKRRGKPIFPIKPILLNPALDPLIYFFKGYIQKRLQSKNAGRKKAGTGLNNHDTPLVTKKDASSVSKSSLLELAVVNTQKSVDKDEKDAAGKDEKDLKNSVTVE